MSSYLDGATVRRIRQARGLSQERIAMLVRVSIPTICRWELGQTQPVVGNAIDLAAVLGVPLAELIATRELS